MPQVIGDWYGSAAEQVGEYFQEGAGQVADYYRDALRSADQLTGASGAAKEIARLVCRRYGENPGVVSGSVSANFERLCRPYLDSIAGGAAPRVELPFRGGQCSVAYNLAWEQRRFDSQTQQYIWFPRTVNGTNFRGPITFDPSTTGTQCPTGTTESRESIVSANGIRILLGFGGCSDVSPGYRNLVLTRQDGQSDSCGNPPPLFRPPAPDPTPEPTGPRPIVVAPGVNIDVDVQIGPSAVTIIGVGVGPVVIDPFAGGGDGGGGGPGGGGPPPGDVGDPAPPEDAEPGAPAAGCAPPNSVLAGVKVSIIETPTGVNQYDPQVWRGACYVYMGVPGNLALDPTGVALRDGQFFVPQADNLTCYEVRANTGFRLRATPYYRALEPEQV